MEFNETNLKIELEYSEEKLKRVIFVENSKFEFHKNPKIIAYH